MAKKMSKLHRQARRLYRRLRGLYYKKQGFSWSGHEMWVYGKKADLERENGISNGEKKALHKQGYLSWHLTGPEGRKPLEGCLSDKDYAYIYPYNSVYAKWVNDNITLRYILPNEKNHLEYYYQIIQRDEKPLVLRMPDLPEGKGTTDRDILELLKEKGRLLFIPSRTKKAGWYQLAYTEEGYTANKEPKEEEELLEFIKGQKGFYQLMEFPKQPAALEEVSFGWLNRLRLIICNEHGNDPFIADARLAWGCSNKRRRFSVVDMETGELGYSYAETFNGAWDRETHPDSELPLVGSIPNWEQIKAEVLETCLNIRECEYFSVDLALKEDGFGYLSFDACPRLPRDHEMSPELMAYFERKKAYRDSWAKMPLVTKSDLKG
ncbi:MAG: hypothetical protein IIV90_05310, partial [Oscillospiraceae bacterium]|nr:hypothetical protein [Oscillospiraceae bacterium]